ncbi:MAG: TRAP transporter small permease subunit [Desulfovibrio sp.]|jgi:TRAP-type C4-dicarboxylate transport system permease small subunit|nr:TRAP transporter small permease subunit [Desulfovibrio sp.]
MKKLYTRFCEVELALAMIALCFSTFLIFASAVARTIGTPINWALEISLFIFAWCIFLSADVALRSDRMMNMDIFINLMPQKARDGCMLASYCIIFVFLIILLVFGLDLAYKTRLRPVPGIPGLSYSWITLSLPLGSLFMMVTCGLKIRDFARRFAAPASPGGTSQDEPAPQAAAETLPREG